jgi:hypothetical protein
MKALAAAGSVVTAAIDRLASLVRVLSFGCAQREGDMVRQIQLRLKYSV